MDYLRGFEGANSSAEPDALTIPHGHASQLNVDNLRKMLVYAEEVSRDTLIQSFPAALREASNRQLAISVASSLSLPLGWSSTASVLSHAD
jgi:hypothetical protein